MTLTASLRANPVFYADAQLVPYGQYTRNRPGGQTQYDVNISYPLDLSGSGKPGPLGQQATKVIEAQYQDAVRLSIDNLYSGYVDVLQARRTIAFAEAGLEGLTKALKAIEDLAPKGEKKPSDVARVRIQLRLSEQQLVESREALTKSKRALAASLNIPPSEADALELFGTLKYPTIDLPPLAGADRHGGQHSPRRRLVQARRPPGQADVKLQMANRYQDVYVLAQPYTLQDNTPFGLKSPTSWALGVTVPLPLYNRNQGNIERSKLNVNQTNVELASEQRQAIQDVQIAEREYVTARLNVDNLEERDPARLEDPAQRGRPPLSGRAAGARISGRGPRLQRERPELPRRPGPAPPRHARTEHRGRPADLALISAFPRDHKHAPRPTEWPPCSGDGDAISVGSFVGRPVDCSGDLEEELDDLGQLEPGVAQAVEVVLAEAARRDDPAVAEQGEVVADGGLGLAELLAEGADVVLGLGEEEDHLEPGRVADELEEDRRPPGGLRAVLGRLERLRPDRRDLRRGAGWGRPAGRPRGDGLDDRWLGLGGGCGAPWPWGSAAAVGLATGGALAAGLAVGS